MTPRKSLASAIAVLAACGLARPVLAQTPIANGHVDLNLSFNTGNSRWSFSALIEDGGEPPVSDVIFVVPDAALTPRPASSAFDFLGVNGGQNYYRLPQNPNPNLLYMGFAGYGLPTSFFDAYDASGESGGRIVGSERWARLQVASVTGAGGTTAPGFFSLWQSGDTGPNVFASSLQGGVTADDSVWINPGGHTHFNFGFSAPGTYEVSFHPSAFRLGQPLTSADLFKAVFQVGNVVVPEPGSLALAGVGCWSLGIGIRRRTARR